MAKVSVENLIIAARSGNLVSFPTDTVPALATIPQSAELIFQAKQRSQDKPLILMVSEASEMWQYTSGTRSEIEIWRMVVDRYLPGALTLVLPASNQVLAVMNPRQDRTIGIRVPADDTARSILAQTGALATTSANRSTEPALLTMAEIQTNFPQVYTLKVEIDRPSQGKPSTVIQWVDDRWKLLRQGSVVFNF